MPFVFCEAKVVSPAATSCGADALFASVQPESIMNRLVRLLISSGLAPLVSMSMVWSSTLRISLTLVSSSFIAEVGIIARLKL